MLKAKSWVPSSYIRIAHHSEFSDPIRIHIAFQILWNATRPRGSARADGVPNPDLAHHSEFSDPIRIHRIWNAMWIRIRIAFQIRIWNAIRPRTWKTFCYQKVLTSAYVKQCFGTHFSGAPWYICWRYFFFMLNIFWRVLQCVAVCWILYVCGQENATKSVAVCTHVVVCAHSNIIYWTWQEQSVLQCVAVVAVCCSVLQLLDCVFLWSRKSNKMCCSVLQYNALECSVMQCVVVCWILYFYGGGKQQSVLQCVAVYCTLMQCNAVCCSSLDSVFSWTKKKQQDVLLSVTV